MLQHHIYKLTRRDATSSLKLKTLLLTFLTQQCPEIFALKSLFPLKLFEACRVPVIRPVRAVRYAVTAASYLTTRLQLVRQNVRVRREIRYNKVGARYSRIGPRPATGILIKLMKLRPGMIREICVETGLTCGSTNQHVFFTHPVFS